MSYSISEIAEMMNVAPSTIRYYDKIVLLPNINRKNCNITRYASESKRTKELLNSYHIMF